MVLKIAKFSWFQFFKKYRFDPHQVWPWKKRVYQFPRPFKYRNIEKSLRSRFNLRIDVRNPKPRKKKRSIFFKKTRPFYFIHFYYRNIKFKTLKNTYSRYSIPGSRYAYFKYASYLRNIGLVDPLVQYNIGRIRSFLSKIELRLDSILVRTGFAFSPVEARRIIEIGFVKINNKSCTNFARSAEPYDTVSLDVEQMLANEASAQLLFKIMHNFKKKLSRRLVKPSSPFYIADYRLFRVLVLKYPNSYEITYPFKISLHRLSSAFSRIRIF